MASAELLEEALSNSVDESAVNAIVGSLENQLGQAGRQTDAAANRILSNGSPSGGGSSASPSPAPASSADMSGQTAAGRVVYAGSPGARVSLAVQPVQQVQQTQQAQQQQQPNAIGKPLHLQSPLIIKQGATVNQVGIRPNIVMSNATIPVSLGQTVVTSQAVVGAAPHGIQTNAVQIVNMRPAAPVAGQKSVTAVSPRVVIGSQLMGTRPAGPGITLQAIPGFQPGQSGGHLLLKTESGQYQLLRVGPPATANAVAPQQGQSIRLTTVAPAPTVAVSSAGVSVVSAPLSAPSPMRPTPMPSTNAQSIQQQALTATLGHQQQQQVRPSITAAGTAGLTQKTSVENLKEKCRKFLSNLLDLSSKEPVAVERNVRILIQELIDMKVEPEAFCARLEKLLDASPQPCLIGFLKKTLPILRQSLVNKELVIEGIHPPPANVVFNSAKPPSPTARTSPTPTLTTLKPVTNLGPVQTSVGAKVNTPLRNVTKSQNQNAGKTFVKLTTTTPHQTMIGSNKFSKDRDKRPSYSQPSFVDDKMTGDDDINDVAAMGGVNLAEESLKILRSTEMIGTQIRSVKDEHLAATGPLQARLKRISAEHGLDDPPFEVASLISHALQERLKNIIERLACIAEHRMDAIKINANYEVTQDVKGQLKFLEDLDRVERKRREDNEREILLRAAKSRSKSEDPEQAKLKEKAKEMQRAEMEEMRQREANLTALQAIGPRKKPRTVFNQSDSLATSTDSNSMEISSSSKNGIGRSGAPLRARMKRVNYKDLLFLLEQEKDTVRSNLLDDLEKTIIL